MCSLILLDSRPPRKVSEPGGAYHPFPTFITTELICPHCYHPLPFSPPAIQLACPTCTWTYALNPEEYAILLDALQGISDLNLQVYLHLLALFSADTPIPIA